MKEIHEAIDILKGLQHIDGEYDHYRETKLYEALRLLESFVEEKPIQVSADPAIVAQAGVWADEKPDPVSVTVNIVNHDPIFDVVTGGIRKTPMDAASESLRKLGDAFKNMNAQAIGRSQRPEKHPFSTLEHPADRHQLHSKNPHLRVEELDKQHRICKDGLAVVEAQIIETIQSGRVPPESDYDRVGRLHEAMQSIETELARITKS